MSWDEYERWPRRRRRLFPFCGDWYFEDIDETVRDMEKMMEDMLKEFTERIPKSLIRERKLSEGGTFRELGPFVWGWSMTMGSDGKPVIREFGNLKRSLKLRPWEPPFDLKEEKEPLVDVLEENKEIRVLAELPGVEKEDIKLHVTEGFLLLLSTRKRENTTRNLSYLEK